MVIYRYHIKGGYKYMARFVAGQTPNISVTKWHDLQDQTMFYDLYINGKVEGRYNLENLNKRILEIIHDV